MSSVWQQLRATVKIKQQSVLWGVLVLGRLETTELDCYVALAVAERELIPAHSSLCLHLL